MHSLAIYTIRVHDTLLPGPLDEKYHCLDNVRKIDLLDFIQNFTTATSQNYQKIEDEKTKKTLKFSDVSIKDRTVYGFIEFGEFGIKGKIVDVDSGQEKYKKGKQDSDVHQLYFNFTIPSGSKKGICVLHNIQGKGVKGTLDDLLRESFRGASKGLVIQIRPLSYEKAVEDWMKSANVKELRLMKYCGHLDTSDKANELADNIVEISYKPKKKGSHFGSLWSFSQKGDHVGENRSAVELMGNFSSSVKAVVELEGKKRVFSLEADSTPVSGIDFDHTDVDMEDGAPKLASLNNFASALVRDILKTLK